MFKSLEALTLHPASIPILKPSSKYTIFRIEHAVIRQIDTATSLEQACDLARIDRTKLRDHEKLDTVVGHTIYAPSGRFVCTINAHPSHEQPPVALT